MSGQILVRSLHLLYIVPRILYIPVCVSVGKVQNIRRRIDKRLTNVFSYNAHFYPFFRRLFVQMHDSIHEFLFCVIGNIVIDYNQDVYIAFSRIKTIHCHGSMQINADQITPKNCFCLVDKRFYQ